MYRKLKAIITAIAGLLVLSAAAHAQLPSPTYGWNLGNTMEAPDGEGTWAPAATQDLIDAVADAGFNTIRIPIAWDSYADQTTKQIDPAWLARVKQVVDWCYARNLTVVINSHWDNGWLDNGLDGNVDWTVNSKMWNYWTQISNTFVDYDSKLLFAAANEPPADTAEKMSELMTYYQTFVDAVRGAGGNNANRWLVLSGPTTDIELTDTLMNTLPYDPTPGRLAVEVHFYGPFNFSLMDEDEDWGKMAYFWGEGYHHPTWTDRNPVWGDEDWVRSQLQRMKTKFVANGVPVLIGAFGAIQRKDYPDLTGADYDLHQASRTYWNRFFVQTANSMGIRPVYWDNGWYGKNGFAVFDRDTVAVVDQASIRSVTGGAALPPPDGGGVIANGIYRISARHSGKSLEVAGLGTADGSNIQQWSDWGGENQLWAVTHLGNNEYSVIGAQSGKALDVTSSGSSNGSNAHVWTYGGGASQKWIVSATSDGYYRLSPSHAPSMCLDVSGVSSQDGANVQIWSFGWGTNQQWAFEAP